MDNDTDFDYMSSIIDEIALEGLDGISLPSLWKRLDKRLKFPFPIDPDSKAFIWDCIAPDENLEFFELPEPRVPLVILNRYANMDMEFGIVQEHEEDIPDPYPYCPVEDKNVKGSCSTLKTRTNVTHLVRENGVMLLRLEDLLLKWAREQFVIVASQSKRNLSLLGSHVSPSTTYGLIQYCLLERIGRSRHHGEVTCGRNSLVCLNLPPKTLFYYRKNLLAHKVLVKQYHYQKNKEGQIVKGSLLQLAQFYVERRSKMEMLIIKMCKILENKPNKREEYLKLREELGVTTALYKKIFGKIFQTCVKVSVLPSTELYPEKPKEEHYALSGKEKVIKIVELVKPYEDHEEDDVDDEDEKLVADEKQVFFSPSKLYADRPLLCQALKVIDDAGPDGSSSVAIGRGLGLPKLEVRALLRTLEKKGVVITVLQDVGRQRTLQYISKRFEEESNPHKKLLEMHQKLMNFTADVSGNSEMPSIMEPTEFNEDINSLGLIDVTVDTIKEGPLKPSKSWSFSLKDINQINKKLNVPTFTYRMLKRANRIIELVKEFKMFDQLHQIQKKIIEEEAEEGVLEKLDRASTSRIVHRLAKDGYIQSIKTVLKFGNATKKLHFICDRTITPDDPLIKRTIEEAKLKYFSTIGTLDGKPERQIEQGGKENRSSMSLTKADREIKLEYAPSIGKCYGFQPKMVRMRTLHKLLCYLVYFYEGVEPTETPEPGKPPVYVNGSDWRKYIPPVQKRSELKEGYIYLADLLLCLPLSLLVATVNYTFKINGLESYLIDEDKCHLLMQHFPEDIRNGLLYRRKHIFSIHEILVKLSFVGLVSFAPQKINEKEKALIYVCRKTCLKDTTTSNPGYLFVSEKEYAQINYEFKEMDNVNNYWIDSERISLHTPLGSFETMKGQTIAILNIFHKPDMEEAMRPKSEIIDDFMVPGDGLGASGYDSAMYAHLKRNWSWPSHVMRTNKSIVKKKSSSSNLLGSDYVSFLNEAEEIAQTSIGRKRLGKIVKKTSLASSSSANIEEFIAPKLLAVEKEIKETTVSRKRPLSMEIGDGGNQSGPKKKKIKPVIRTIAKKNYKKVKKPYYDEADKVAMRKMTTQRVQWTAQEDSFLLMCKVASCFLDPNYKMVVPYSVIRDLIQNHLPHLSMNKTSRACQRRIAYMLKTPATVTNVSVYFGEANQDGDLVKQFQGPKPNRNQDALWKSMFIEVLEYLLKKFTNKDTDLGNKVILPISIEELRKKFDFSKCVNLENKRNIHVTPKNSIDIHCSVVFSMVLQSLNTAGDRNNWSLTLYKIYQSYPDTLLRSVQAKLISERIITKRKDVPKKMQMSLPLSSLPHKLSLKYEFILQGEYQEELFYNTHVYLKKLQKAYRASQEVEVNPNVSCSEAAVMATLMAMKKLKVEIVVPEQIIVFDSKVMEEFQKKLAEKSHQPVQRKDENEELEDFDENVRASIALNPSRASRFALYMMRHDMTEPVQEFQNLQHAHDSFLINSCKLKPSILPKDETDDMEEILNIDSSIYKAIEYCQKKYLPDGDSEILTEAEFKTLYANDSGFSEEESNIGWNMYSNILNKKEIGCTNADLVSEIHGETGSVNLLSHLNFFIEKELILRVGVVHHHYVALKYAKPWILNSIKIPREMKSLSTEVVPNLTHIPCQDLLEGEKSEALEALQAGITGTNLCQITGERSSKRPRLEEKETSESIATWFEEAVIDKVSTLVSEPMDFQDPSSDHCATDRISTLVDFEVLNTLENVLNKCTDESGQDMESSLNQENEGSTVERQIVISSLSADLPPQNGSEETLHKKGKEHISLKSWLEAKVMHEVEALHQTANKSSSNSSSVAEINRWLQESIVKKLEDKCSVEDIKLWFQKCILAKVENQSAVMDLQQWFQESILKTLEDETFLNDLELMREAELKRTNETNLEIIDPPAEIKLWFEENVLKNLEGIPQEAIISTKMDLSSWFKSNVLDKVEEKVSSDEINQWFKTTVLEKVESESLARDMQEWFETYILKKIEKQNEMDDFKHWFNERFSVIADIQKIQSQVIETGDANPKISSRELKDWFDKSIVEVVENKETLVEISEWFDSKVLVTIEALNQVLPKEMNLGENVSINELKKWLFQKIISRVGDYDDVRKLLEETIIPQVTETADLKKWFEEELLSVIEEMDHNLSSVETPIFDCAELSQWLDVNLLSKIEEIGEESNLKSWLDEKVLKEVEETLDVNSVLKEAMISVLSCLKGVIIKIEDAESKSITKAEFQNVLSCVKNIISSVEAKDLIILDQVDFLTWFESRISSVVEQSIVAVVDEKEILSILETDILNKIEETDGLEKAEEADTGRPVPRKRRRRVTHTSSSITSCQSLKCEKVRFISRIWKKPDGSLNRPVLKKMLAAVLSYVMSYPGICESKIFDKFEMCMQPVQVLDILEILEQVGCVETIRIKKSDTLGLFSEECVLEISRNVKDICQPSSSIYYEGTIEAILKLGSFFDFLTKR